MVLSFTKKVFRTFGKRIKNRFSRMGDNFSEDYVRYVLFTSLFGKKAEKAKDSMLIHMDLECPYEKLLANNELEGKKLDMWASKPSPKIAIECKYHREKKSARGCPMSAGNIFEDFRRLSKIKMVYGDKANCYFVYVTTDVMAEYLNNRYDNFFELKKGESAEITKKFILSEVPIFKKQINKKRKAKAFECTITNVFADEFCKEESKIYIRIFKVDI